MEIATDHPTDRSGGSGALVLGRYRLARRLGSGGFGTVFLAHDERLDRAVAVKRIGVEDPEVGARAQREAKAAARLSHPGIVALHEAAQEDDAVYLVSELVRGRTLARLMTDGLLSDRDVVDCGMALCDALHHAHGRGVVHRDVKPANVMVGDEDGPARAKLTDFGIAQLLGDDALTRTGDIVGTLAYMAPEQAEGRPITPAVDLYALGLVLYEALAGVNPVRGRTPASTVRRVGLRLPPLGRMRRDLPLGLCRAIDAAVGPHPEQRGTLKELKGALKAAATEVDDEPGTVDAGRLEPLTRAGRLVEDVAVHEPAARAGRFGARSTAGLGTAGLVGAVLTLLGPPAPADPILLAVGAGAVALALPRLGWPALVVALTLWCATQETGTAVLLLLALSPTVLLVRRAPAGWWNLPATAVGLALLGVAGAFPALAGQARLWHQRAALGALGAWCIALAEPLAEQRLALGRPPQTVSRDVLADRPSELLDGVLGPLLAGGGLVLAAIWALAALVLPLVVRGRSAGVDALGAVAWAAALAIGSVAAIGTLSWDGQSVELRGVVLSAGVAGIVAVAARATHAAR